MREKTVEVTSISMFENLHSLVQYDGHWTQRTWKSGKYERNDAKIYCVLWFVEQPYGRLTTNALRSLIINAAKYVNNRRYFIYIRIHTNSLYFIIDFYVSQAITKSNLSKTFSNESLEFNIQKNHPLS